MPVRARGGGCEDINSRSIGIELTNTGDTPFAAAQMDAVEQLIPGIMERWAIRPERVIGHSDMAPLRKVDPGARFDWRRLALGGLSIWPDHCTPVSPDLDQFRNCAIRFGYPDVATIETLLTAFRLRFRPWARGALEAGDMAALQNLADRFPVDQPIANT